MASYLPKAVADRLRAAGRALMGDPVPGNVVNVVVTNADAELKNSPGEQAIINVIRSNHADIKSALL